MLEIVIPENEYYVERADGTEEFVNVKETKLQLEHSLISIKKWESKWHKPFLGKEEKTLPEILDYIQCMTINHGVDPEVYKYIPGEKVDEVVAYIKNPMTATTFNDSKLIGASRSSNDVITNEIIYYWMIALQIPVEFQKWHLEQLLTLIKVVNIKNSPKNKMSKREEARQRAALNAARRAKSNSKG
jgi:hypothetical protein